LPEYDVFDDPRYFQPAPNVISSHSRNIETRRRSLRRLLERQDLLARTTLHARPADELIEMGASARLDQRVAFQQRQDGPALRDGLAPREALGIPIVFVNLVGGNDGIIFDGASIVADARGKIILQAPPFEEFIGTVDLDCGVPTSVPARRRHRNRSRALVLGIRDYARKNGSLAPCSDSRAGSTRRSSPRSPAKRSARKTCSA
jgi:NAD+ synthase (glutamine-hydrolysing)